MHSSSWRELDHCGYTGRETLCHRTHQGLFRSHQIETQHHSGRCCSVSDSSVKVFVRLIKMQPFSNFSEAAEIIVLFGIDEHIFMVTSLLTLSIASRFPILSEQLETPDKVECESQVHTYMLMYQFLYDVSSVFFLVYLGLFEHLSIWLQSLYQGLLWALYSNKPCSKYTRTKHKPNAQCEPGWRTHCFNISFARLFMSCNATPKTLLSASANFFCGIFVVLMQHHFLLHLFIPAFDRYFEGDVILKNIQKRFSNKDKSLQGMSSVVIHFEFLYFQFHFHIKENEGENNFVEQRVNIRKYALLVKHEEP